MVIVVKLVNDQTGQSMTEYGLLLGVLVALAAVGLSIFGGSVLNLFTFIRASMTIL